MLDSTTGKGIEGAYVFYREKNAYTGDPDAPGGIVPHIDQQSGWSYVRTDLKGAFSLQLKEGTAYLIRAELPGYRYSGYIDVSASEAMGQTPVAATIEYIQPISGTATSTTNYYVYLAPLSGTARPPLAVAVPSLPPFPCPRHPPLIPYARPGDGPQPCEIGDGRAGRLDHPRRTGTR